MYQLMQVQGDREGEVCFCHHQLPSSWALREGARGETGGEARAGGRREKHEGKIDDRETDMSAVCKKERVRHLQEVGVGRI